MTGIKDQEWRAHRYRVNARFVSDLGRPVVDLLAPKSGQRILDLGCGDGALTEHLAGRGADVVGVDGSQDMVLAAVARGLDARRMDGHGLTFDGEFDAVFSNAALHWMKAPDQVLSGVRRALRPEGRFVAEMGGFGNVASVVVAILAVLGRRGIEGSSRLPWYFPTPDEYRVRLVGNGFVVDHMELIPRPTPLPTGITGWLDTFASWCFALLPEREVTGAKAEIVDLLRPVLCDQSGNWSADYVRLRFAAHLAPV